MISLDVDGLKSIFSIENIKLFVGIYTITLSVIGGIFAVHKLKRHWRYRYIKKILGIKDKQTVLFVCSELDNPEERQLVEPPREFIYLMKYGDVDAWVETLFSILRIYPNIELRLASAGEISLTRADLCHHIIVIGGPDYNSLVARIFKMDIPRRMDIPRIRYHSPDGDVSKTSPNEITLVDSITGKEYCCDNLDEDFGYFERIANPFDDSKNIILIGGCHTVGVTGASKMFSAFSEGRPEVMMLVRTNARKVAKLVGRSRAFSLVCRVDKIGSTISTPTIERARLFLDREECPVIDNL